MLPQSSNALARPHFTFPNPYKSKFYLPQLYQLIKFYDSLFHVTIIIPATLICPCFFRKTSLIQLQIPAACIIFLCHLLCLYRSLNISGIRPGLMVTSLSSTLTLTSQLTQLRPFISVWVLTFWGEVILHWIMVRKPWLKCIDWLQVQTKQKKSIILNHLAEDMGWLWEY